jgi:hypothetical protein
MHGPALDLLMQNVRRLRSKLTSSRQENRQESTAIREEARPTAPK